MQKKQKQLESMKQKQEQEEEPSQTHKQLFDTSNTSETYQLSEFQIQINEAIAKQEQEQQQKLEAAQNETKWSTDSEYNKVLEQIVEKVTNWIRTRNCQEHLPKEYYRLKSTIHSNFCKNHNFNIDEDTIQLVYNNLLQTQMILNSRNQQIAFNEEKIKILQGNESVNNEDSISSDKTEVSKESRELDTVRRTRGRRKTQDQ